MDAPQIPTKAVGRSDISGRDVKDQQERTKPEMQYNIKSSMLEETPTFELSNLQIDEVEPPVMSEPPPQSPNIVKPSFTFPRNSESNRARAEEINSGSKVVPRVELAPKDYFGLAIELEAWFSMAKENHNWSLEAFLDDNPNVQLVNILTGLTSNSVKSAVHTLISRVNNTTVDLKTLVLADDFNSHTLLFLCLCAKIESGSLLLDEGVDIISELIEQISLMRWMVIDEQDEEQGLVHPRLIVLLRLAILATLGDCQTLKKVHGDMWKLYELDVPKDNSAELASPINYAMFMSDIEKRYPAYTHTPDENHDLGLQLKERMTSGLASSSMTNKNIPGADLHKAKVEDPSSLVNNPVMPYVPVSIVEACDLFKANVCPTPQMLQLYEQLTGTKKTRNESQIPQIAAVRSIYEQTLGIHKSFIGVLMDVLHSHNGDNFGLSIHGTLSCLSMLLQWFEATHVLMFEHLSAILFDYQFHFAALVFCQKFPKILNSILCDYTVTGSSVFWEPLLGHYNDGPKLKWAGDGIASELIIQDCNRFQLQSYIHLMTILRLMVVGKAQRVLVVAEMSIEPFKKLFNIHESELWSQILQFFKALIPFTGRRWRYLNIELISAIYLYCPSRLDDNWLNGADIHEAIRNAPGEELELRKLIDKFSSSS